MAFNVIPQGFADILNMRLQKRSGGCDMTTLAETQKFGMLGRGALHSVRERELKPGMPIAFLKEVGHNRQCARLPRVTVQQHMKFCIQFAPASDMVRPEFCAVLPKDLIELLVVVVGQMAGGGFQEARLKQRS
jgi:hypothetical protein